MVTKLVSKYYAVCLKLILYQLYLNKTGRKKKKMPIIIYEIGGSFSVYSHQQI